MKKETASAAGSPESPHHREHDIILGRLFGLSHDLLCVAGFDGYFKQINPSWQRTLGWTDQEMLSRPYADFVHPDDRDATVSESASLTSGETTISFENRYRCRDGSYRWLEWSAVPYEADGLIYAAARDVTNAKRTAQLSTAKAAIARLAVGFTDQPAALLVVLEAVSESLGWELGQAWLVNDAGDELVCASSWSRDPKTFAAFITASRGLRYRKGEGLPGHAWERDGAVTMADVAEDPGFLRRRAAAQHGLHGAVAFPIRARSAVWGVLTFFSREVNALDDELGATVDEISYLVGALLDRLEVDAQMRLMAYHDSLTGLPNRILFLDRVDQALRRAERGQFETALMMGDLDGFKVVNDTLGHKAGDDVLRHVAHRMAGVLRATDTVARLGGDEFGFIPDGPMTAASAKEIGQKLRDAVAHPYRVDGEEGVVRLSLGIAITTAGDLDSSILLQRADRAMYGAKRTGKGIYIDSGSVGI